MNTLKAAALVSLALIALAPGDSTALARPLKTAMRAYPAPETPAEAPPWMAPSALTAKDGDAPYGAAPETPLEGFAPLSVVQDGMAYTPGGLAPAPSGAPAADTPGASATDTARKPPSRTWTFLQSMGITGFGNLPEPATWALMLIGFAMIGSALRGFILANRRLARLRAEDDTDR